MKKIVSYERFQEIISLYKCVNPDCSNTGHSCIREELNTKEIARTYKCDECHAIWTIYFQPKFITETVKTDEEE